MNLPSAPNTTNVTLGLSVLLALAPLACFQDYTPSGEEFSDGDTITGDEIDTDETSSSAGTESESESESESDSESDTDPDATTESETTAETGDPQCGDRIVEADELCLEQMPDVTPLGIPGLRLAVGNFDEHLGVAVVGGVDQVAVLFGEGDKTLGPPTLIALAGQAVSVDAGDLDVDGDADIVTLGGPYTILRNLGAGNWTAPIMIDTGGLANEDTRVVIGQLDGNAPLDFVRGDGYNTVWQLGNAWNGWSPAQDGSNQFTGGDAWVALTEWGFDGDGLPDMAVSSRWEARVSIVRGMGNATYEQHGDVMVCNSGSCNITELHVADLDADGNPDVIASFESGVSVIRGKDDGTFQPFELHALPGADHVASGDINNDGNLDLAVASVMDGDIHVLLGDGTGDLGDPIVYETPSDSTRTVELADLDNDGALEILTAYDFNNGGWVAVFGATP